MGIDGGAWLLQPVITKLYNRYSQDCMWEGETRRMVYEVMEEGGYKTYGYLELYKNSPLENKIEEAGNQMRYSEVLRKNCCSAGYRAWKRWKIEPFNEL